MADGTVTSKILEGVFAINKPPHLSSAQVVRDLQYHFEPSKLFAPLVADTLRKQEQNFRGDGKRRRGNRNPQGKETGNLVKIGHGGTLDPLATGVLIVGVGRNGTKHLNSFLACTKTYETVVLFGKSTDTYDIAGKIIASKPYEYITRQMVEKELGSFRGTIKQVPPIYSALKINGMKAYEYARSGKELPRELESRQMEVEECELVEWFAGGTHGYTWPAEEAAEEDKRAAAKLMGRAVRSTAEAKVSPEEPSSEQSSLPVDLEHLDPKSNSLDPTVKAALHTHHLPTQSSTPSPAPAARIRLTVSSGFYVRSFAHDLGIACDSYGIMAELARTRQAEFATEGSSSGALMQTLTYGDLEAGETVWGPKVRDMLEGWMKAHPRVEHEVNARDRDRFGAGQRHNRHPRRDDQHDRKRPRNSSSPEA